MKGENGSREELLRRAGDVRSHMLDTLEEFERRSHDRIIQRDIAPDDRVRTEEAATSAPRRKLERRADRVRNRLIDRIEALERKGRQQILPVVVTGGAILAFLTVGFGVLLYRSLKS